MKFSRRDCIITSCTAIFTFCITFLVPGQERAIRRLPSSVFDWQKLDVKPTRNGERRAVLDSATMTLDRLACHVTTVNANEAAHDAHRHPDEEIVIVKEGMLEATINGEAQRAGAGSLFFFAANDLHGLRNAGDTPASYFVLRWTSPGKEGTRPSK